MTVASSSRFTGRIKFVQIDAEDSNGAEQKEQEKH
jgi:hypothetical protein